MRNYIHIDNRGGLPYKPGSFLEVSSPYFFFFLILNNYSIVVVVVANKLMMMKMTMKNYVNKKK